MKDSDNWFTELEQYSTDCQINIDREYIRMQSYNQYKLHVKQKIRRKIDEQLEKGKRSKTKLRTITPGKKQQYLKNSTIQESCCIMKVRLHMVHALANFGGGKCRRCNVEEETTEHVLNCHTEGVMEYDDEKMEDVQWLRKISIVYKLFDEQYPIKN